MIKIPLGENLFAVVDDSDFRLAEMRWSALVTKSGKIYARRRSAGRTILLHREVLGLGADHPMVDHLDGDGLNCSRENLSLSSNVLNARNRAGAQRNNHSSGHLGVNHHKATGEWEARIGRFKKIDDAVSARLEAEKKYWGIAPQRAAAHKS